jgi:L-asparagine transporter-like permease
MMKPEDYIDENYVPTEEDFAPEAVDEKEELLKYIKKSSRIYIISSCVVAIAFTINAIVEIDMLDSSRMYTYPLIAAMLLCVLVFGYIALIYYRIFRAKTAQEMRSQIDRIGSNSLFSKAMLSILALCVMAGTALAMMGKCHWAVTALVVIVIGVLFRGFWWLFKDNKSNLDQEIEKLQKLEKE